MVERMGMFIDGKFEEGSGDTKIKVHNPATEELIGTVPVATEGDIESACASAQGAFRRWRQTPASTRGQLMVNVANAVRARADEIAKLLTLEQGKTVANARGEVLGFCAVLQFYAEEARRIEGKVLESDDPDRLTFVMRQPVGVVAAIPPWNDPLHLLSRIMGPALVAGCTVVSKPSSETPLATLLTARIAAEAGLPPGVWNVITGPGGTVGEQLVRNPMVRKVALTGSVEGGRRVMELAAQEIKRVTLELGGQCPCIVMTASGVIAPCTDSTRAPCGSMTSTGPICTRLTEECIRVGLDASRARSRSTNTWNGKPCTGT